MEAVFLTLIGAALFSQSWYVLGMYSEGRTMAVFVGGLGLLSLGAITLTPMLITGEGSGAELLPETTIMKTLIALWALYAIGVAAQGIWDLDERAIGFYSVILSIATLLFFMYYAVELESTYSVPAWLAISVSSLLLTIISGLTFFYLAFAFKILRLVTGWFLLLGGGVISVIGLCILTTVIV